jgi:predicted transcriptional regulator
MKTWTSIAVPKELAAEIWALSDAEDRTREAIMRRAIALYRQTSEAQHNKAATKT